ncbi:hypothetical protein GHT06_016491 [Daphnia sinensis]|uniref:2-hydroxyacyl-CoA lyase 2 n=1 Tax=Daphnia sinensis TaxID=1820382 RepID=A0AAD5L7F1_9CRUS|nr:hypothetical protein GHT06_016491 [Daphnia sinensis]
MLEILAAGFKEAGISMFLGSAIVGAVIGWGFKRFNLIYLAIHQVDKTSKRNGGEIVAQVLHAHNIKQMFTLAGGHISPILAAAEKIGITVVDTRHEVSAVFAADAVARMTGTVGVVAVTAGPGLTNTVTAIKNAQMAESPILLLGGAAATILKGRGALQDIDQMSLFRPLCKYCVSVTSVRDIAPILRTALQIAQSDTPGPVFIEMPIDVLYSYDLVKREVGAKSDGKGLVNKIVNWYLNNYVDNIFAGAWEPVEVKPLAVNIPMPTSQQVSKAVQLLSKAKRPLILMGSQSTLPPVKSDELVRAINRLGIPCYLGGMSRGLLGSKSSLQARQHRRDALKEADLIILAGSVCDFRLSYGRVLPRKAPIIAVNRNKDQLCKNSDMFWKPAVAVQADVGTFLVELSEAADGLRWDPEWVATLQKRDKEKELATEKMAAEETETHLNPLSVLHSLEKVLPDNAILVADGGDFVGSAAYILRPRKPLSWLDPGAFGTLGVGGGFALGAKLARPDSEVWIVWGDGSCGYSVAEFDTFTRFKLPVMSLVGNDAAWTQILREQVTILGTDVACKLNHTDYHVVAQGYGGLGYLLKRENANDIERMLNEAREESHRTGKSVLINTLIGKTGFRDGSISV